MRPSFPKAIPNINHPEDACDWMGIGGQVLDRNNNPVTGLIVNLGGLLPGVQLKRENMTLTGISQSYGRAGFEFILADKPVASKGSLWIQLVSQSGAPLSDKIYFDTYNVCEKNLILLDFIQVR